jgi:hypothetical protein
MKEHSAECAERDYGEQADERTYFRVTWVRQVLLEMTKKRWRTKCFPTRKTDYRCGAEQLQEQL